MINAHPGLIVSILQKQLPSIKCEKLDFYIENRETILQRIQKLNEIDREKAKNLVLRIMYGGSLYYK